MKHTTYLIHANCSIQAKVPEAMISDADIKTACLETPLWVKQTLEKAFYPGVVQEDLNDQQKLDLLVSNALVHQILDVGSSGLNMPWDGMLHAYDWLDPRQHAFFLHLRKVWVELFPKHPAFEDGDFGRRISKN